MIQMSPAHSPSNLKNNTTMKSFLSPRCSRSLCCAALVAASLIPVTGSSQIVSDNFTSAVYSAGTSGAAGTRYIDSTVNFFSTNTNTGGGPALIATDTNAPLAGNVAQLSGYANNSVAVASFTTQLLDVANEYITISLNYRSTVGTTGRVFLGLYNDGSTPLTANLYGNLTAGSELDGDKGYNVNKTLNSTTNDMGIYSESMSILKTLQFATNNGILLNNPAASSGISGADTSVHSVSLTITRLANSNLTISSTYDSFSTSTTVAAGSVLTYSFNQLAFAGYGSASNFDNILVTTGVVPEPSTVTTLLGGLALLVLARRYRRTSLQ